jgi:hypothetical protein
MSKTKLLLAAALAPVVMATLNVGPAAAQSTGLHQDRAGLATIAYDPRLPQGPVIRTPTRPRCPHYQGLDGRFYPRCY